MFDKALINASIYYQNEWKKLNIYINGEKIAFISEDNDYASKEVFDYEGKFIIPGLIDPHVHFNLHLTSGNSVDDFYHGSRSAIYGGVTMIIDFLEPASNASDLERKYKNRLKEAETSMCDYHLHACLKDPDGDLEQFVIKMKELGMNTLKIFTTYSDSKRMTKDENIIKLLRLSEKYKFLLLVHAEDDNLINLNPFYLYKDLPTSRPTLSEVSSATKLANFVRTYGGYLYMVHVSSGQTLNILHHQFKDILHKRFFIETCPQYFVFNNEVLNGEDGNLFTFAPPLRSEDERQLLMSYFADVDVIATDHCAFNKKDKNQKYLIHMPLGVGGVEHSFKIAHKYFGDSVIERMSKNPAKLNNLLQKGDILIDFDADLVVLENKVNTIDKTHGRADYSIYEGIEVNLDITDVFIRGEHVLENKEIKEHKGKLL